MKHHENVTYRKRAYLVIMVPEGEESITMIMEQHISRHGDRQQGIHGDWRKKLRAHILLILSRKQTAHKEWQETFQSQCLSPVICSLQQGHTPSKPTKMAQGVGEQVSNHQTYGTFSLKLS